MGSSSVGGRMLRVSLARQGKGLHGALLEPELGRKPLGAHLGEAQSVGAVAGDDDEIDPGGQELRPETKTLAAKTFDPVATHGRTHAFCHDEAETCLRRLCLRGDEQSEMGGADSAPRALRTGELRMSPQSAVAPELEAHYFL